jgi:class 3 adenylate cyclase
VETRKTVTIVFCDITGSTALGERLEPEALRDVQSRYFDAMRSAVEHHGGTVEKYIGDAVMAVFGVPHLHEDDALRATRAAAEMREVLIWLNKELERDRGVTLQVRVGVETGPVIAGQVATGQALVTGDAVNAAVRLQQTAAPDEVLLGDATHALVRDAVEADPIPGVRLRGKSGTTTAWRLAHLRPAASGTPRRLRSPMVGRDEELLGLLRTSDLVRTDRACHRRVVLGPAGVGKSRLVAEFLETVSSRASVLQGRCLPSNRAQATRQHLASACTKGT